MSLLQSLWSHLSWAQLLSRVWLFVTSWIIACQTPLSMRFFRREHRTGNLPDPGVKPVSPTLAGRFFTTESPGKPAHLSQGPPLSAFFHTHPLTSPALCPPGTPAFFLIPELSKSGQDSGLWGWLFLPPRVLSGGIWPLPSNRGLSLEGPRAWFNALLSSL